MRERLQKILSARGVASRRAAEKMIEDGQVLINGNQARLGDTADVARDVILVDGIEIPSLPEHVYIMLNKPRGYVTTMSDEKGRKTVADLVKDVGVRVYPVGRLDINSDGLLVMTNDGDIANKLMHPSREVRKTYMVRVRGVAEQSLDILRAPIEIDGRIVKAREVLMTEPDKLEIVITEGRNRQIRRMCETAGLEVRRLTRVAEGGLQLGSLGSGKWRYLTAKEVKMLEAENG